MSRKQSRPVRKLVTLSLETMRRVEDYRLVNRISNDSEALRQLIKMGLDRRECAAWNAKHPVGTKVTVRLDSGETRETVTRSAAEVLSGHSAVIWLDGITGCYLLDRVTPLSPGNVKQPATILERITGRETSGGAEYGPSNTGG
jgi:hypothetical protein